MISKDTLAYLKAIEDVAAKAGKLGADSEAVKAAANAVVETVTGKLPVMTVEDIDAAITAAEQVGQDVIDMAGKSADEIPPTDPPL